MGDSEVSTVVISHKYRLLVTRRQHATLQAILDSQRLLYNAALQERIDCYSKTKRSIGYYDQQKSLTVIRRDDPQWAEQPANLQRWTLKRLDDAYCGFFRRMSSRAGKAGLPRFRSKNRWRSFGFLEFKGIQLQGKRIRFIGMPGALRLRLHRPLPAGKPLACTFTKDYKGWSVSLHYRVLVSPLPHTGRSVGIDLGLTVLAMLSTGEAIHNPRVEKAAQREMRRRRRALSRCQRASNRRSKIKLDLTRLNSHIRNSRSTKLHQVAAQLVRNHDMIAVEKLNVKGMAAGILAGSIKDAAWSKLKEFLVYKAAKAGRQVVEVKAAGTSQTCHNCGQVRAKSLAERVHRCDCGCVMDRDHAAAVVVLQRAVVSSVVSQREALACA